MCDPSRDDGTDDWSPNVFPTHWWRSGDDSDNAIFSTDKETPELILTIDVIVNMLRVITVCPPKNLALALISGNSAVPVDERTRLTLWCENLSDYLATL